MDTADVHTQELSFGRVLDRYKLLSGGVTPQHLSRTKISFWMGRYEAHTPGVHDSRDLHK